MRLVVTMTTLPNRYDHLHHTLKSIHNQTIKADAIYVTIPKIAKRSNKPYPPLPKKIKSLCTPVYIDVDYGPICKVVGALLSEKDPDTLILSVDDDICYPPNMIEVFLQKHKIKPNAVITGNGVLISCGVSFASSNVTVKSLVKYSGLLGFDMYKGRREVSILQGASGVLYKRSHFSNIQKLLNLAISDDDLFRSDDIVLSAYLCNKGIKIYTFHNMPQFHVGFDSPDALSMDMLKMIGTFKRAVQKCHNLGMFKRYPPCSVVESPVFKIPLLILCIIALIILSIYIILHPYY